MHIAKTVYNAPTEIIKKAVGYQEETSTETLQKHSKIQKIVLKEWEKSRKSGLLQRTNDLAKKLAETEVALAYRKRAQNIGYTQYIVSAVSYLSPQLEAIGNSALITGQMAHTFSDSSWSGTINKAKGAFANFVGPMVFPLAASLLTTALASGGATEQDIY